MDSRFGRNLLMASSAVVCIATATPALAQTRSFDVPAQEATSGVAALARQANIQIFAARKDTRGKRTNAVRGDMTVEQALSALLSGTGLTARRTADQTYTVVSAPSPATAETSETSGEGGGDAHADIVVTGTNIRGVVNTGSPVRTLGKEDIIGTGATTAEGLFKLLPENVSGQAAETVRAGVVSGQAGGVGFNPGYANGINLRGLGSTATLVLLNGHRLPITSSGSTVDVSAIPLAIVQRVDLLKDGASSVYGSDAVAGVVNFITTDRLRGVSTTLTTGTVTSGGKQDVKFDGAAGTDWSSGNLLFSYTFNYEGSLSTSDRTATRNSPPQFAIAPTRSHQIFGLVRQDLTDRLTFSAQSLGSFRYIDGSDVQAINRGQPNEQLYRDDRDIHNVAIVTDVSLRYDLQSDWEIRLNGQFSSSKSHIRNVVTPQLSANSDVRYRGENYGGDFGVDGPVVRLPGGDVRLAVGVAARHERYYGVSLERSVARSIESAFAEIFIPVVGRENASPGIKRLELTASDRYDHYSDFGGTNNPKFGVLYAPVEAFALRATYSTSFRAPLLAEIARVKDTGADFLFRGPDAESATGTSLQLIRSGGGNPDLKPEEAESVTAGLDLRPLASEGFKASVDYFHIDFRNRIQKPSSSPFLAANPSLYAPYITRNPSSAAVSEIVNGPYFTNLVGAFNPADIVAIVDNRLQNAQRVTVSGLDFSLRYLRPVGRGRLALSANASYLISYKDQLLAGLSPIDRIDTTYYPTRWRVRGTAGWTSERFAVSISSNFVNGYDNNLNSANIVDVSSWTTFDAQVRYAFPEHSPLHGISASFSVSNLFDKNPPFVRSNNIGGVGGTTTYNYDPVNASLLGRYVSFSLSAKW